MKKLIPFMVLAVLLFAACSKKSTPADTGNSLIVGKWHYSADTVKTYTNGSLTNTSTSVTTTNYLQFNADGQGITGNDNSTTTDIFGYTVNGTTLTCTPPGSATRVATIKKLTANNLALFFDNSSTSGSTTTRITEAAYLAK